MPLDSKQLLKPMKKLEKLTRKIRRDPPPKTVHALRTTARRVEATLFALHLDERESGEALLKDLAVVRKQAGKVRDCDVLTRYTASLHPGEKEQDCLVRLLESLGAERHGQAKQLHRHMRDHGSALRKELKATRKDIEGVLSPEEAKAGADENPTEVAAAKALELASQLSAPQRLAVGTLHPYRLTIKQLQDTLRLATGASHAALVDELGRVKDAIGEWHDWEALASLAAETIDHHHCRLLAALQQTEQRKRKQALAAAARLRANTFRKSAGSQPTSQPVLTAIAMLTA